MLPIPDPSGRRETSVSGARDALILLAPLMPVRGAVSLPVLRRPEGLGVERAGHHVGVSSFALNAVRAGAAPNGASRWDGVRIKRRRGILLRAASGRREMSLDVVRRSLLAT